MSTATHNLAGKVSKQITFYSDTGYLKTKANRQSYAAIFCVLIGLGLIFWSPAGQELRATIFGFVIISIAPWQFVFARWNRSIAQQEKPLFVLNNKGITDPHDNHWSWEKVIGAKYRKGSLYLVDKDGTWLPVDVYLTPEQKENMRSSLELFLSADQMKNI